MASGKGLHFAFYSRGVSEVLRTYMLDLRFQCAVEPKEPWLPALVDVRFSEVVACASGDEEELITDCTFLIDCSGTWNQVSLVSSLPRPSPS